MLMHKSTALLCGSLALAVATIGYYALDTDDRPFPPAELPAEGPAKSPQNSFRSAAAPAVTAPTAGESEPAATDVAAAPVVSKVTGDPSPAGSSMTAAAARPADVAASGSGARPPQTVAAPARQAQVFGLPPGLQAPAALIETDPSLKLSPLQEDLKKEITKQFLAAINGGVTGASEGAVVEADAWTAAQARADSRFRKLFGDAAYMSQSLNAARIPLLPE